MSFAPYPVAARVSSRRAVFGFWLWAAAVVLFGIGVILGIALNDAYPGDMGIGASVTIPLIAALIGVPVSTVGLGFAIASLVKGEPRRGLAITTIVLWVTTPAIALAASRTLATLVS